jgi:hypothetical protein
MLSMGTGSSSANGPRVKRSPTSLHQGLLPSVHCYHKKAATGAVSGLRKKLSQKRQK